MKLYNDSRHIKQYTRNYEDMPGQGSPETAKFWCLHLRVHPGDLISALEIIEGHGTGEYTYGDSWREWMEVTDDPKDMRLGVYFEAIDQWGAGNFGNRIARLVYAEGGYNESSWHVTSAGCFSDDDPNL